MFFPPAAEDEFVEFVKTATSRGAVPDLGDPQNVEALKACLEECGSPGGGLEPSTARSSL